ncbi:hypothetical protein [Jutongia sp.]
MFRKALAPAGTYAPSFKYIFLICLVLGALCTAAWCSGSGSVPSEIAEPAYGAQSCGCVFIKALQSKDFSEILLICVNFNATSSRLFKNQGKNPNYALDIRNSMGAVIYFMCEV